MIAGAKDFMNVIPLKSAVRADALPALYRDARIRLHLGGPIACDLGGLLHFYSGMIRKELYIQYY